MPATCCPEAPLEQAKTPSRGGRGNIYSTLIFQACACWNEHLVTSVTVAAGSWDQIPPPTLDKVTLYSVSKVNPML